MRRLLTLVVTPGIGNLIPTACIPAAVPTEEQCDPRPPELPLVLDSMSRTETSPVVESASL